MNFNGDFYLLKTCEDVKEVINAINQVDIDKHLYAVKIAKFQESRTQLQNRYLWGWVYAQIVKQLNDSGQTIQTKGDQDLEWTKDLLHEAMKTVFLALEPIETKKGIIKTFKSTASLNKKEFSEYVANIKKAAYGWFGITISEPLGIYKQIYYDLLKMHE